jgi:hypothetical protein
MTILSNDPFASAVEAAERSSQFYGQVEVSAQYVVLKKGQKKMIWQADIDDPKDRSTEVSLVLNPIEESNMRNLVQRSLICESAEWTKIVWPSLRDGCGLTSLRDLDKKFVKIELVKNGRSWEKNGEKVEGTTFKFLAIYSDQAACVAGYLGDGGTVKTSTADNGAMDIDMSNGAGSADVEKETAKQFLGALVKQAGGNKDNLKKMLDTMPMVNKYFNVDSPEVSQLMKAA